MRVETDEGNCRYCNSVVSSSTLDDCCMEYVTWACGTTMEGDHIRQSPDCKIAAEAWSIITSMQPASATKKKVKQEGLFDRFTMQDLKDEAEETRRRRQRQLDERRLEVLAQQAAFVREGLVEAVNEILTNIRRKIVTTMANDSLAAEGAKQERIIYRRRSNEEWPLVENIIVTAVLGLLRDTGLTVSHRETGVLNGDTQDEFSISWKESEEKPS